MGRFKYYDTVDDRRQLSLSRLRKWGCLKGWSTGTINWTNGFGESTIEYEISLYWDSPYMRLYYTSTNNLSGEKTDYDYRIQLTKTKCQYGGYRWWFLCPYCCQKVTTLMSCSKGQYGCRRCLRLSYDSRQQSYYGYFSSLLRAFDLSRKYHKLHPSVKKMYYQGRLTKKFRRLLQYKAWLDSTIPLLQHELNQI